MFEESLPELPTDPVRLAERLAGRDCVSLFWGKNGTLAYLACDPVEHGSALDPEPTLALSAGSSLHAVPRWVGLMPYEARRELERAGHGGQRAAPHLLEPHWVRYAAVAVVAADGVRVVGEDQARVRELAARLRGPARSAAAVSLAPFGAFEAPELHRLRIRRALEHIRAGDLYQVNLARRFDFQVRGAPWHVLARMLERGPSPYAAAFSWGALDVISVSPELFLSTDACGSILTSPIKGTRPRGSSAEGDAALARELDADPKERAELTMVLDVERNDLARLAVPGSVRLTVPPHVEAHGTVLHRVATLRAQLRPEVSRTELLHRMLPSGSVTGAPKVRAMDLIAELEAERRGLYTGAFGYLAHDGTLELGMAIRTLTVREGQGHYFAGGGIVADSDPEREVQETLWKAEALLGLLR
ncbi:MAG TPA: anthranilate synthase component I family protein [Polyangiaceae bacterium]|jgi:anthranilate/para-aminobenzoate synthase component I|nr:anthranilate synthase component I family protein [Polyangiaceae bacterium]